MAVRKKSAAERKVAVVTGATGGIGKVTAQALATGWYRVVLVCRDPKKALLARAEIVRASNNTDVEIEIADFASLGDVRAAAGRILKKYPRIDLLVNNAGAIHARREVSADGYERTFAVNHLAPFLFTNLLLPALKAAPAARVVNLSSDAQRMGRLRWDDLHYSRKYSAWGAYARSKLANAVFSAELARRLAGTRVVSNAMHPGVVRTGFGGELGGFTGRLFHLFDRFMRTPEKGAETAIWLATAPEAGDVSGKYFQDKLEKKPRPEALDSATGARFWQVSADLVGLGRKTATAGKPAAKKPVAKAPAAKKPAAKKPAVKKPAVKKPAVKKPAGAKPAAKKPAAKKVAKES